jgi:DNA-binding transcriptional MerR regulator
MHTERMLTLTEAAAKPRRNTKTLQRWDRKGVLKPASRTKTNRRMYTVDQIEVALAPAAATP